MQPAVAFSWATVGLFKSGDCPIVACASGVSPVNKLVGSPLVGIFSLVISALLIW